MTFYHRNIIESIEVDLPLHVYKEDAPFLRHGLNKLTKSASRGRKFCHDRRGRQRLTDYLFLF